MILNTTTQKYLCHKYMYIYAKIKIITDVKKNTLSNTCRNLCLFSRCPSIYMYSVHIQLHTMLSVNRNTLTQRYSCTNMTSFHHSGGVSHILQRQTLAWIDIAYGQKFEKDSLLMLVKTTSIQPMTEIISGKRSNHWNF